MFRRITFAMLLGVLLLAGAACTNKHVKNPLAQVDSKQPDKVLFDRAMDAMKHNKYDVARMTLQALINTYPDSEYVARAKLGIGDSWYAEGGSAAWAQAESEYRDFQTFFPNMPEAAEAQYKIAEIHYRQMEKPDRDYTHAKRAEDEFRTLLLQYPDSKLVPEARVKLLQVQEVLAEREYRIGHFYYMRQSWPAAIARLKSLTDTYPLYSKADEALYELGDAYATEATLIRNSKLPDTAKNKLIREYEDNAAVAFSKIITRYPVMPRAEDARKRLAELDRPIPKPTEEAIALNKKEEESRGRTGRFDRIMDTFHKRPDVAMATKVGEPTLVDPKQTDAATIVRSANEEVLAGLEAAQKANNKVSVQPVAGNGKIPESQPTPRSDPAPAATGVQPAPGDQPAPAPRQVNEINDGQSSSSSKASSSGSGKKQDETSSSKSKKKHGLRKLIPF